MSKPLIHAKSSVKKFGGQISDYEPIHSFLDSSKSAMADNRHRALTHTSWFLSNILERIKFHNSGPETPDHRFPTIINSDGREISIRDIGEQHCVEDYRGQFIPSAQDFLQEMDYLPWMQNGEGELDSKKKLVGYREKKLKLSKDSERGNEKIVDTNSKNHFFDGVVLTPGYEHNNFIPSGVLDGKSFICDGSNIRSFGEGTTISSWVRYGKTSPFAGSNPNNNFVVNHTD